MKIKYLIIIIILLQIEYLPIPLFNDKINYLVGTYSFYITFILFIFLIIYTIIKKKFKSFIFIPLILIFFMFDYFFSSPKRNLCNSIIIQINRNRDAENHINPILGVIMKKDNKTVTYDWSFIFPETGSTLIYNKNHNYTNSSGNTLETIVLDKDWYREDFDIEF